MKGLLDPKMDFVFKNIFGSEKHPNIYTDNIKGSDYKIDFTLF